eukprot:g23849.t1
MHASRREREKTPAKEGGKSREETCKAVNLYSAIQKLIKDAEISPLLKSLNTCHRKSGVQVTELSQPIIFKFWS